MNNKIKDLNQTGSDNPSHNPQLSSAFTESLIKKVQHRQTLKDWIFMIVIGFYSTLLGFLKLETLQNIEFTDLESDNQE